ncbi:inositol-3-phosphate synthase OS=Streptomyces griseomycini OX=66895 GN=FHS37_007860 PE=3 SV=1 [Streptomyces griseomycini]
MNNDGNASEPQTDGRTARTGVWFVGARGSVATTAVAGCAAVTAGLRPPTGMVTETPPFDGTGLPPLSSLVFGGHDTADCPLPKRAEHLTGAGVLPHGLASAVHAELRAADEEIRPGGPTPGDTRSDEELITDFAADLTSFRTRNALARVVVVNVSSTEPLPAPDAVRLPPSSPLRGRRPARRLPLRQLHAVHRAAHRGAHGRRRGQWTSPRGP